MSTTVAAIVVGVVLGMLSPQLPLRTRLSFGYLALVTIGLGVIAAVLQSRGLAVCARLALVCDSHLSDVSCSVRRSSARTPVYPARPPAVPPL